MKIRDTYADARVHFVILVDQAHTWIKVTKKTGFIVIVLIQGAGNNTFSFICLFRRELFVL